MLALPVKFDAGGPPMFFGCNALVPEARSNEGVRAVFSSGGGPKIGDAIICLVEIDVINFNWCRAVCVNPREAMGVISLPIYENAEITKIAGRPNNEPTSVFSSTPPELASFWKIFQKLSEPVSANLFSLRWHSSLLDKKENKRNDCGDEDSADGEEQKTNNPNEHIEHRVRELREFERRARGE